MDSIVLGSTEQFMITLGLCLLVVLFGISPVFMALAAAYYGVKLYNSTKRWIVQRREKHREEAYVH